MQIRIRAFGIAKDILKAASLDYTLHEGATIRDLRDQLTQDYPDFARLTSLSFALDETYVDEQCLLTDQVEVILIPPVSGG